MIVDKKQIVLTVDPVIVTEDKVILIKRAFEPYENHWALPGGIVEYGETVENAAVREAKEETGLDIEIERLVGVYSKHDRDPRGHFVSICFFCRRVGGELRTSEETREVREFSKEEIRSIQLAFDHRKILKDAGVI